MQGRPSYKLSLRTQVQTNVFKIQNFAFNQILGCYRRVVPHAGGPNEADTWKYRHRRPGGRGCRTNQSMTMATGT